VIEGVKSEDNPEISNSKEVIKAEAVEVPETQVEGL
jgi:hypothetical protein